jgi:hypothetical protein
MKSLDASEEKTRWKEEKKLLYFEKLIAASPYFSHWDTSLLKPIRK